MTLSRFLSIVFFLGVVVLTAYVESQQARIQSEERFKYHEADEIELDLKQQLNTALQSISVDQLIPSERGKRLFLFDPRFQMDEAAVNAMLRRRDGDNGDFLYGAEGKTYTMSAPGIDERQHLVNAYLVGYQPFETRNVMLPMYILSRRKSYVLDEMQYDGRTEVWQTSREAFFFSSGDCEDHAVALADWLIEMGEDARVVLGLHGSGGHAWVVLFKDGKEFILEATRKGGVARESAYPLASLYPSYQPEYMFNREHFWANTGTRLTTRYSGNDWSMRSRYSRG